ncbi:MAG TPA: hypothetical protein VFU72_00395, partial [Nitrolancea sp.]|nr:hypothetical protein [Nitrolancea sp.]
PATEPVMDVAVVTESTLPEVAEAPRETALEPPASSEEATEAPAVEPPAADEQLAAAEPVAKTVEAEEPAAAAEQSAPEEPLVAQEEPAANEHRTVAGEPEAEEGADTGVPEQAVAEAGQQEQEREQELVAVGAAIAAQAQSTEAGEAPTAGPAPEAGNEELAAEAAVLGSEETAEASAEPTAGPGTPSEEAAPPVTEPSSTRQLFDALSAADQPAEAELLQQLRAEIAFLRQQMREKDRQIAAWITESRRKDLSLTRLENRLRVVPGEHGRARNGTEAPASTSDLLAAREQLMAPLAQRLHQLEDRLGSLEASRAPRRPAPWYRRLIGSGSDRQSAS